MGYLVALPSLLCGLAISIEDIRHRRVPRLWVAVGCLLQLVAVIIAALAGNTLFLVIQSAIFALVCTVIQCGLALLKPGSLGFGDVTTTLVMGLAVGTTGLWGVVIWWLAMGALGLVWILFWQRFDWQRNTPYAGKVPFAPVIVVAAVIALGFGI